MLLGLKPGLGSLNMLLITPAPTLRLANLRISKDKQGYTHNGKITIEWNEAMHSWQKFKIQCLTMVLKYNFYFWKFIKMHSVH